MYIPIWMDSISLSTAIRRPDYVFTSSHRKPTLTELETFINQKQHLPDIPSAAEVKEKGLNLSEMNATLLKKIEELTLYIIEQDKRIQKLEQRGE